MSDQLRAHYLRALPGRIEALESALHAAEGDANARANLRRMAHSLKGSGASYGFPRISEAAGAAESATDAELDARVGALLEVMRESLAAGTQRKD